MALLALWTAWWASESWHLRGLSWHFFHDGSRWLTGAHPLLLFADHPELQTGPLALLVARALGKDVALVLMAAAGPLLLLALAPLVATERRLRRLLLAGLVLTPAWCVLAVRWGHLDDVLAMAGAVVALRAACAMRPVPTGLALAAALAAKPWAVGFLPLLLVLRTGRARAAVAAAAGTAVAWAPFVLATRRTLAALHPPVALVPSSGLHALGVRGDVVPAWGRVLQLLAAPAAALVAAVTRRPAGVLLVALAVRLALDPQDNAYYVGSAALAAAVFDLLGTRWTVPWTTVLTVVALWQPFVADYPRRLQTTTGLAHWWFAHPGAVGFVHLVWVAAVMAVVLVVRPPEECRQPDRREGRAGSDGRSSHPSYPRERP